MCKMLNDAAGSKRRENEKIREIVSELKRKFYIFAAAAALNSE
jgi:hypothetical protein